MFNVQTGRCCISMSTALAKGGRGRRGGGGKLWEGCRTKPHRRDATERKSHARRDSTPFSSPPSACLCLHVSTLLVFDTCSPGSPCQPVKLQSPGLSTAWHTHTKFTERRAGASSSSGSRGKKREKKETKQKSAEGAQRRICLMDGAVCACGCEVGGEVNGSLTASFDW